MGFTLVSLVWWNSMYLSIFSVQKITDTMLCLFREWITTVTSWPPEFVYKPMKEIGLELSMHLRDLGGEYRCDFIIALMHCR